MLSWAEDKGPHLGAVMAEDDRAEVPTVVVFDEILCRVEDLKTACSQAVLLQKGLVQSKDDLKERRENIGPFKFTDTAISIWRLISFVCVWQLPLFCDTNSWSASKEKKDISAQVSPH